MRFGTLKFAALMLAIAALLHGVLVFTGGGAGGLNLAIASPAGAALLFIGWRWLGWIVMLALIVVFGVTLGGLGTSTAPAAIGYVLAAAQALAIISLFLAVWKGRERSA